LNRPAHLTMLAILALVAGTAQAAPAHLVLTHAALAALPNPAWQEPSEEPSAIIGTGDFNRDGIADVVEAISADGKTSGQHFLTVLLGKAGGGFKGVDSHNPIGSDPAALVVGDFNGDGKPDVIVGGRDGALLEFLGDGKGNLAGAGTIAHVGSVASLAIGRFTHERSLDLIVSDFASNSAVVLLGAGNGSFRYTWSFPLPRAGTQFHLSIADFNKDGIADVVISTETDENYEVMLGTGTGTFTYAPELSHLRDPYSYCPS
jgi:hypothetical protein